MSSGCNSIKWIKNLKKTDKNQWKKICRTIREDGPYVEAGENDNLIIQKLNANPDSFGIFGFSFLDQNNDQVKGSVINGVSPTFEAIADGDYKISRSLYFYVKKDHIGVIPGIKEFLLHFVSNDTIGEDGYLIDKGLIPLPEDELVKYQNDAKSLTNMSY
jgi:phosphate transport system substrate-binding protein